MQQKVQYLAVNIYKACRQQMLYNAKMASLSSKMETCWTFNILKVKGNRKWSVFKQSVCSTKSIWLQNVVLNKLAYQSSPLWLLTFWETMAPARRIYRTVSRWLFSQASIKGVRWSSSHMSMFAPAWEWDHDFHDNVKVNGVVTSW